MQYATSVAGPFTTFADGTSSATVATVTGLTNGTAYVFRVAAVNVAGAGTASAPVAATPLAAPGAPTITALAVGSRYIQVTFTPPASNGGTAITGYEYQLDGGTWRTTSATGSPMTIAGLTNGHTYQVAIRALNAVGAGAASNVQSAKPYGLPGAVAGFVAAPGTGNVALSWDAVDDNGSPVTAYNIVRWSAATEGSILATYQTTATTYTVTGLANGTHYFTIEATNAAGTGPRSSPRTSARVGAVRPGAPTIDSVVVAGNEASMTWTAGTVGDAPASGFIVQYSTDDTTFVTVAMGSSSAGAATVPLPSVDAPYSLRVATISAVGVGAFATVRPPRVTAEPVSAISASAATVSATVDANTSDVATAFELAGAAADLGTAAGSVVAATPASVSGPTAVSTSATLAGLAPGTTYYVRARATSANAVSFGTTQTFTTAASVTSSGLNPVYTGAPAAIVTVTDPVGLPIARTFEGIGGTAYPLSATAPTDVGTYRVTTTVLDETISGAETATLTITPKPLSVVVTAEDKPFDGTTDASLTFELDGMVDGDDLHVDATKVTGTFADAVAGTDKVVSISADPDPLTGADAANYTPSVTTEAIASIARAEQLLAFTSTAPDPLLVGATYVPTVISSAGLTAQLGLAEDSAPVCSLADGEVLALAPGLCVVVATQAGTANVAAAYVAEQFVTVAVPAPGSTEPAPPTGTVPPTGTDVAPWPGPAGVTGPNTDTGTNSVGGVGAVGGTSTAADSSIATGPSTDTDTGAAVTDADADADGGRPDDPAVEVESNSRFGSRGAADGAAGASADASTGDDSVISAADVAATPHDRTAVSWMLGFAAVGCGFVFLAGRRRRRRGQES
jgi:titin